MSSSPVPASTLLNSFVKAELGPVLIDAGFKASGRVFRRPDGEAIQVVDFQNWKYNDSKRARFTVEVGVCFPRLLAAVSELDAYAFYREKVGKPGVTECAVRRRLGELMDPPQDLWWTISATTGYVPSVEEVTAPLIGIALPWMRAMSAFSAVAAARAENHALTNRVMAVAALFALGDTSAAKDAAIALAKARHPDRPELEGSFLRQLLSLEALHTPASGA
jgi:Domain of unknown function (DUF4304)